MVLNYRQTGEVKECQICGREYYAPLWLLKKGSKYCSRQCRNDSQKEEEKKVCIVCGSEFFVPTYRKETAKYCSSRCQYKSMENRTVHKCLWCGKEFTVRKSHGAGMYCSRFCSDKGCDKGKTKLSRRKYAKTRAKHLKNATPRWVNKDEIKSIYDKAKDLSHREGIKYHVDHIIPLFGNGVCGLHVPWNLQIIPAIVNLRKSNEIGGYYHA